MESLLTPFKVGLLVIAGLAAGIFLLTRLTSDGPMGGSGAIVVYGLFDDATGLAERSRVLTAGIAVGEITSIRLEDGKARVNVSVRDDLALFRGLPPAEPGGPWTNGATLAKRSVGVIGDYYIELIPGSAGERLGDGDQVMNIDGGADLSAIFRTLDGITKDISEVTTSLSNVFGGEEGQRGLEQILRDLQTILAEVAAFVQVGTEKLDKILTDGTYISADARELADNANEGIAEILDESKIVVRDVKVTVRNVRDIVGQSSGDVQAGLGSLSGALVRLQSTLDSLNYSLQNVQDITDKVNEGEGTIGALVNDPAIAEKADAILADTLTVTGPIGRLRTIIEMRSEYHFSAQQFKNVLGLRLEPRKNKYFLIELVDDFRFDADYEVITQFDEDNDPVTNRAIRRTDNNLRLSAQYALGWDLWGDLSLFGRFGLIESTGGVGTTLVAPLSDSSELRTHAELFDFDIEGFYNPRVRLWAEYIFFDNFRFIAGLDDILNPPPAAGLERSPLEQGYNGLSPYLSIGFVFTDEDLKGLLTVTGVPVP